MSIKFKFLAVFISVIVCGFFWNIGVAGAMVSLSIEQSDTLDSYTGLPVVFGSTYDNGSTTNTPTTNSMGSLSRNPLNNRPQITFRWSSGPTGTSIPVSFSTYMQVYNDSSISNPPFNSLNAVQYGGYPGSCSLNWSRNVPEIGYNGSGAFVFDQNTNQSFLYSFCNNSGSEAQWVYAFTYTAIFDDNHPESVTVYLRYNDPLDLGLYVQTGAYTGEVIKLNIVGGTAVSPPVSPPPGSPRIYPKHYYFNSATTTPLYKWTIRGTDGFGSFNIATSSKPDGQIYGCNFCIVWPTPFGIIQTRALVDNVVFDMPGTYQITVWRSYEDSPFSTPNMKEYLTQYVYITTPPPPLKPDLTAGPVTPSIANPVVGAAVSFSANISNLTNVSTNIGFNNLFQVINSSNSTVFTSVNNTSVLTGNSNRSIASPTSYSFPAVGNYSVRACADNDASFAGLIDEGAANEGNNCGSWTVVTVGNSPVNGVCGTATSGSFSSPPNTNLCTAGTPTSVNTNPTTYTWQCLGANGGTDASCSATRTSTAQNGQCGTAVRTYSYGSSGYSPYVQCSVGSPSSTNFPSAGNSVSWTCSGVNGGSPSGTCTATQQSQVVNPSVTINKTGNGSVTGVSSPVQANISCGISCTNQSIQYTSGTTIVLTATPAPFKIFTGWGGDCSTSGTNKTCTLTVNSSKNVSANFINNPSLNEF